MHSEDLRWTVLALGIQREVGGNLSNILETAAGTIKGRAELRREVRTLSAEGRLSGYVLAALPVGLFLYMLVANREYVSFFWTNVLGYFALGILLILFILGLRLDAQTREDRGLMNSFVPILAALIVFGVIVYVGFLLVRDREARIKRRSLAMVAGYASADPHSVAGQGGAAGFAHPQHAPGAG